MAVNPRLRLLLVALAAVGVGALFWFRGPDWGKVGHALAGMSWTWALVAVGFNILSAIARGLAWRTVVVQAVPPPHPRLLDLFSAFFVGIFANGVLPGRVGEVARVGVLVRRLPPRPGLWPALLGSVVAHRLLEIVPSIGLIVWVLVGGEGAALGPSRAARGARLRGRRPRDRPARRPAVRATTIRSTRAGSASRSRASGRGSASCARRAPPRRRPALQTLAWVLQLLAVWTAMRAFHFSLPITAAGVVLALMNVALILPLWPGNVGLQQAAIALPLIAYGIPYSHGFAYGIGLQAIESSVGYVLGIVFLVREGLTLGRLRAGLAADRRGVGAPARKELFTT